MTTLELLVRADRPALTRLLSVPRISVLADPWDNRPTWDNQKGDSWDNRPSWDNWNKK